jgi:hypothetical protein
MLRSTLRTLSRTLTSSTRRPARTMTRRTTLAVEALEDRLVLSTTTLHAATRHVVVHHLSKQIVATHAHSPEFTIKKLSDTTSPSFFQIATTKPEVRANGPILNEL